MQIGKHKVVSIDYTLTDEEGAVLDSSDGHTPLLYLHGVGEIIPGLERALEGQAVGDEIKITVQPADAYGEHHESLRSQVDRSHFEDFDELEEGMQFRVPTDQGDHRVVTVIGISDETVMLDANHPLAGVVLNFEVAIRDIRDATEAELSQGYAGEAAG